MKRRIVRITAGALFILAWAAAGVYAFWGGDKAAEKAAGPLDPAAMSRLITTASQNGGEKNPGSPAKPPVKDVGSEFVSPLARPSTKPPAAATSFGGGQGSAYQQTAAGTAASPPARAGEGYGISDDDKLPPTTGRSIYGQNNTARQVAAEAAVSDATDDTPPPGVVNKPPARGGNAQDRSTFGNAGSVYGNVGDERPPTEATAGAVKEAAADPQPTPAAVPGVSPFDKASRAAAAAAAQNGGDVGAPALIDEAAAASPTGRTAPVATPEPLANIADVGPTKGLLSATPGNRQFEGAQAPALVVEKFAPPEIQIGKPATFEIVVKNSGKTAAQQVVVTDHVPQRTQFISAKPQPLQADDGALVWQLGAMQSGEEKTITLELMPREEGEVGSVAEVTFAAAASARTLATRPLLAVEQVLPAKVLIGDSVTVQITITNPGSGAATGVVLMEDVPEGLSHASGKELEYEVGTLQPNESRKLELLLVADKAGQVRNTLVVKGDANVQAQHTANIEVVAPQLAVAMNGPKMRYLDRQATYTVAVANNGTAAARDVEIVAYLPKGMKFVSTDRQGQYDQQKHAVFWSLEELPAAQKGEAQLVTIPFEAGEQKLRVEGRAQLGLSTTDEETVQVEAIPQLAFEIVDEHSPIEVGAETVYSIKVTNIGSKAATSVQIAAGLPPELRPESAEGATRGTVKQQNVIFEALPSLAPKADATYKIKATGLKSGDYTIRVQVASEELQPVTKEERTRVYADQ